LPTIQAEIHAADRNLPLINARTMSDVLRDAMWVPRTGAALLVMFGSVALSLAIVGIYGVTAFFVRQRRREIGIRLALGATAADLRPDLVRPRIGPSRIVFRRTSCRAPSDWGSTRGSEELRDRRCDPGRGCRRSVGTARSRRIANGPGTHPATGVARSTIGFV